MNLPDSARELIGRGADATLVTINPDGSPHASLVWVALQSTPDGDELVSAHLSEKYQKIRNVRRDPRVTLTILPRAHSGGQTPYLSITGTARIVEGGAPELLTELAEVMLGPGSGFPPTGAPAGFLTRVRIDKVGGLGPWAA
ncbi:PPOX class F420-dependent oxidoreductase [Mycobacterium manitobense]|uniref:PPOX class F420-dependent oxidoreductase n=1 Tax=[Mycobacterium] manitobense TaxID=190147 RepID=A0A9X2Y8Y5_9MYCO|nr:PPOX class F420-dependent oxidoreductase [[Mycobacterium] manitobense]MCV7170138.1 PPOX class F420-dependent oxidoreductase [[Mycobacterium] manitobense]